MNNYISNIIRFVSVVLVQVLIFNNIRLSGYINPYFYIYFILMLPFETPRIWLLILSFFLGFSVDLFSDTLGMHAAACVFIGFIRPGILKMISSRREYEPGITPTIKDLGIRWFLTYSIILTSVHHLIYFYIEVFRFSEFGFTLLRALISIVFTMLLLFFTQLFFYKPNR